MEDDAVAAEAAFLEFFNTFDIPYRINSLSELDDGTTLAKILYEIDPQFFNDNLPNASGSESPHWTAKWKNREFVEAFALGGEISTSFTSG
ncbi:MAG: hypothetical protein M1837_004616 [Sclerophora amabilis]|nr:MAG: hypothetical protein M1837_004616 [Sclerophora amabilis]